MSIPNRCGSPHRGGAAGIRTPDLRRARAALSRLSYGPQDLSQGIAPLVGAPGLEPGTSALSGPRSNHLSYAPSWPRGLSVCVSGMSPHTPYRRCAEDEAKPEPELTQTPAGPERPCRAANALASTNTPRLGPPGSRRSAPGCLAMGYFPRKEVIQPQLPLRLPCYDFVPITSPTLDSCAPCGFAHRLQVLPAFMT